MILLSITICIYRQRGNRQEVFVIGNIENLKMSDNDKIKLITEKIVNTSTLGKFFSFNISSDTAEFINSLVGNDSNYTTSFELYTFIHNYADSFKYFGIRSFLGAVLYLDAPIIVVLDNYEKK